MTDEEEKLVQRFCEGDEAAVRNLYKTLGVRIYRLAYRLTGSTEDAEDVVVQTFQAAFAHRETFGHRSSLSTWFFRIAVRQCGKIRGQRKTESMPHEELPDRLAAGRLLSVELEQIVAALPTKMREAFVLVRVEQMSHQEAAQVLGRRTGTVQAQVHEASKRIRAELNACHTGWNLGADGGLQHEL